MNEEGIMKEQQYLNLLESIRDTLEEIKVLQEDIGPLLTQADKYLFTLYDIRDTLEDIRDAQEDIQLLQTPND